MPYDGDAQAYLKTLDPVEADEILRDLRNARSVLSKPEHWVKGAYRYGSSFCLIGALGYVAGSKDLRTPTKAADYLEEKVLRTPIISWNDDRRREHADVVKLLDVAIIKRARELNPESELAFA